MSTSFAVEAPVSLIHQFFLLTKPRVISLIVFTAVIGMFLATPGMVPPALLLAARYAFRTLYDYCWLLFCRLVEQKI